MADNEEPPPNRPRREGVAAERLDPDAPDIHSRQKTVHTKSSEQLSRLSQALKNTFIFNCLEDDQMNEVIDSLFEKKVKKGEEIIKQGERGDNFYLIESGSFDIFVLQNANVKPKKVGVYINSGSFGELALMYNTPRAATICATSDGILWCMDRNTFRTIVLKSAQKKRLSFETFLKHVPILTELKQYERLSLADCFQSVTFKDNDLILLQGQEGREMFFIQEGKVKITMRKQNQKEAREMAILKVGDYFGELALLTKNPRAASAHAIGRVKLAKVSKESFERLLGPCLDIMRRNIATYEQVIKSTFGNNSLGLQNL